MQLSPKAHEILTGAAARIERHRKADGTIRVVNAQGKPVRQQTVQVEMTRHAFLFGANIFPLFEFDESQRETYGRRFRELLNYATLGFYWGAYEPEQGRKTGRELQQRIAQWCKQHGIATKGHPLVWHEVYPRWASNDPDAVKPMLQARVREIVREFRGLVDRWDVINEPTVGHKFENGVGKWLARDGAAAVVRETLRWARAANPNAFLVCNDYNISPEYEKLIEALLQQETPLDAIGIQSHMHSGEWTLERAWEVCQTYARFGKPLHFTEVTVLSGQHGWELPRPWRSTPEGEARQAEYVERFYTLLFSHPAVEAITWWDLADARAWQGAPAGLLREDLTPKPAYERLRRLIREQWWTPRQTLTTDSQGRAQFRGFLGAYQLSVGGKTVAFQLRRGRNEVQVRL
ncbi:MAG: endo-1,4-beta-xylanase [Fimbriimonadales bacterium]|nr:endo-1,4-beta-xylanase [Fimbriimonadales bacterium]